MYKLAHGESEKFRPLLEKFAPGRYWDEIQQKIKAEYGIELTKSQIITLLQRLGIKTGNQGKIRADHARNQMFYSCMADFVKLHQYDYDNDEMEVQLRKNFPEYPFTRTALIRFRRKYRLTYRVFSPKILQFCAENRTMPRKELCALIKEKFGKDISRERLNANMSWHKLTYDLRKSNSKRIAKHKIGDMRERHGHKGKQIFVEIMIAPNVWVPYHRYLYEKYNNCKLGPEMNVIFIDGNRRNFDKDNLYAVPVKYMAQLSYNRVWSVTRSKVNLELGILLIKLNERLHEIEKKKKEMKKNESKD